MAIDNRGRTAAKRPDGLPVGKPFEPGKSGNPNGRPKGAVDIMTRVQNLLEGGADLPAALKEVIRSRCGGDKKALDAIFISLLLEALQGDAKAAKELLDRGYGKVADKIVGDPENPVEHKHTFTLKIDNQ